MQNHCVWRSRNAERLALGLRRDKQVEDLLNSMLGDFPRQRGSAACNYKELSESLLIFGGEVVFEEHFNGEER